MTDDGDIVRLEVLSASSLLPHEETIGSRIREMVADLRREGLQKDPIIVDGLSSVVLDGMHRLGALRELGISHVVCHLVDYASPRISLSRWARVYDLQAGDGAAEVASEIGLASRCSVEEGLHSLEKGEVPVAGFSGEEAFLPEKTANIHDGFETMRRADRFAESRHMERSFLGEDELGSRPRTTDWFALLVRRLHKEDVLKAGLSKRPFPCKTSMHVVDPRPVAVNVPLDELDGGSSSTLRTSLKQGRFKTLPPGSRYEGRSYRERLVLVNEK